MITVAAITSNMKWISCFIFSHFIGLTSILLNVASFFLAIVGNFFCHYASTPVVANSSTTYYFYHGIWSYLNTTLRANEGGSVAVFSDPDGSCTGYAGTDIGLSADTKWKTAKAFSIIAAFIGGGAMFLSCSALAHPKLWKAISVMLLVTTLSQGLTFLFLTSNECYYPEFITNTPYYNSGSITMPHSCALASGGKMALSATVMWFVSALAAIFAHRKGTLEMQNIVAEDKQEPMSEECLEAGR